MPSTNTDTAIPTHSARSQRREREPGFGGEHRGVGEVPGRDPHHRPSPPGRASSPRAVHASRSPVATNSGTAAATTRPHIAQPAAAGPVSKRMIWDRSRSGRNANPSDGLVDPRVRVRDRPREEQHDAAERRRRPRGRTRGAPSAPTVRSGSRPRARPRRATKSPRPAGYHAPSNAASTASRRTRPRRVSSRVARGARRAAAGTGATRTAPAVRADPARSRCGRPG